MLYKWNLSKMLRAEFAERRALQADPERRLRELEQKFGIPPLSIGLPYGGACSPLVDDIDIYDEDNCFEFSYVPDDDDENRLPEDEILAVIFPIFDEFGYPRDLVAIVPSLGRTLTCLGNAASISINPVKSVPAFGSLTAYNDPVEFLRGGCQGVLILDGPRAASELRGLDLRVANETVAARLRTAIRFVPPTVNVAAPELYKEFSPAKSVLEQV